MGKLIIDGNCVYEVDEACMREKEKNKKEREAAESRKRGGMLQMEVSDTKPS